MDDGRTKLGTVRLEAALRINKKAESKGDNAQVNKVQGLGGVNNVNAQLTAMEVKSIIPNIPEIRDSRYRTPGWGEELVPGSVIGALHEYIDERHKTGVYSGIDMLRIEKSPLELKYNIDWYDDDTLGTFIARVTALEDTESAEGTKRHKIIESINNFRKRQASDAEGACIAAVKFILDYEGGTIEFACKPYKVKETSVKVTNTNNILNYKVIKHVADKAGTGKYYSLTGHREFQLDGVEHMLAEVVMELIMWIRSKEGTCDIKDIGSTRISCSDKYDCDGPRCEHFIKHAETEYRHRVCWENNIKIQCDTLASNNRCHDDDADDEPKFDDLKIAVIDGLNNKRIKLMTELYEDEILLKKFFNMVKILYIHEGRIIASTSSRNKDFSEVKQLKTVSDLVNYALEHEEHGGSAFEVMKEYINNYWFNQ